MWTRNFWIEAWDRAIKSMAQTALIVIEVAGVGYVSVDKKDWQELTEILHMDWVSFVCVVGVISGVAGVKSILTSVGSSKFGDPGSPTILK